MSLTMKSMKVREADNFAVIRLVAAITVVYGHSFPLTGSGNIAVFGNSIEALAVKVFFVVSGYLITESWILDPSILRYFLKRALRIFPALTVVVVVTAVILGPAMTTLPIGEYFDNPSFLHYFSNIYLFPIYNLPGVFAKNIYPIAVNGSLWSLPVEFSMYIIVPILLAFRRGKKYIVSCATLLVSIASLYILRGAGAKDSTDIIIFGTSLHSALDVAPFFLIGATLRSVTPWVRPNLQIAALMAVVALLVPPNAFYPELALYVVLPYAVIAFAMAKPARFAFVERIGDLSYGTYLFGFPVQQIVIQLFGTAHHPLRTFALALPPTLLCAYASWHVIERRFMALKPRRRPEVRAAVQEGELQTL